MRVARLKICLVVVQLLTVGAAYGEEAHCTIEILNHLSFFDRTGKETRRIQEQTTSSDADNVGVDHFRSTEVHGCRSGHFGLVVEQDGVADPEAGFFRSTDTLRFYAADGQLLWEKKALPLGDDVALEMSQDDRRIWYSSALAHTIVAIDEKGKQTEFHFPRAHGFHSLGISPNGRYGWMVPYEYPNKVVFIDLLTGAQHEFLGKGNPHCSDDGLAEVREFGTGHASDRPRVLETFQFKR